MSVCLEEMFLVCLASDTYLYVWSHWWTLFITRITKGESLLGQPFCFNQSPESKFASLIFHRVEKCIKWRLWIFFCDCLRFHVKEHKNRLQKKCYKSLTCVGFLDITLEKPTKDAMVNESKTARINLSRVVLMNFDMQIKRSFHVWIVEMVKYSQLCVKTEELCNF